MTRFVPALAAALLTVATGFAHADTGTLPNGVVLKYNRLFTHSGNSATHVQPNLDTEDEWHYFNFAHCECALDKGRSDADFHETTYSYEVIPSSAGTGAVNRPLEMWVGSDCDNAVSRPTMCRHLAYADVSDIAQIQSQHSVTPEVSVFDLMTPTGQSQCPEQVLSATQWLLGDTMANGTKDYSLSVAINTDTLAPPLPTAFNASGAENAIDIKWTAPDGSTGDPTDIAYFQALCADASGQPAIDAQYRPTARYITPQSLCNSEFRLGITQSDVDTSSTTTTTDAGTAVRSGLLVDAGIDDAAVDAAVDAGLDIDAGNTQPTNIPTGFAEYDPTFLCGEADSKTATELRINHLQNGVPYQVMFLAIDKYGNPRGTVFRTTLTPKAVTDFWEDLHGQGSNVEGGFCLIAETFGNDSWPTTALRAFRDDNLASTGAGRWLIDVYYGSLGRLGAVVSGSLALRVVAGIVLSPLVAVALVWHYLTFPGLLVVLALPFAWRRRRKLVRSRLAGAVATLVVVVCMAPRAARADGFQPYWQHNSDGEETGEADEPSLVHWQAGLRIGPYTPQVDAQLGKPVYGQLFGSSASILPMIDVDRVIWHGTGIGTVAVGATIGYLSKTGYAYQDMTTPGPDRPRSTGDTTSFSLIPFALTIAYRATQLDDDYNIPIVPFLRVGLGYYVWWVRAPNGDYAQVCKSGMEPDCAQNTARGASMGITGELGLAIRAERIDADAARSMRESGLLHAGFFAEYQLAKVDGFGSDKKLAVGDNTWFAGVNFEF